LSEPQAFAYFGDLMQLVLGREIEIDLSQPWHDTGPVFGDPRLAPYRLAQKAFQAVVLNTYRGHCAITGTKIRQAGQVIALPTRRIYRPHREFLEWHLDEVFKAS
jgi:hypothetical protein